MTLSFLQSDQLLVSYYNKFQFSWKDGIIWLNNAPGSMSVNSRMLRNATTLRIAVIAF